MPDVPDANRHENPSSPEEIRRLVSLQTSLGQRRYAIPRSRAGNKENDPGSDRRGLGCEAKAALGLWHKFAHAHSGFALTGQRSIRSDLDLVQVIENEAQSLYAFARSHRLDGPSLLQAVIQRGAKKTVGSEHLVFLDQDHSRVFKVTREGKYGRLRDTPSMYLGRLALMNEIAPALDIRFEDFFANQSGEGSFLTSMTFFKGAHPGAMEEVDDYLIKSGFESFSDQSGTLDYLHRESGIIFRDCHPANWISFKGKLVPIDIIPEWKTAEKSPINEA